jgi:hypothetical protein
VTGGITDISNLRMADDSIQYVTSSDPNVPNPQPLYSGGSRGALIQLVTQALLSNCQKPPAAVSPGDYLDQGDYPDRVP